MYFRRRTFYVKISDRVSYQLSDLQFKWIMLFEIGLQLGRNQQYDMHIVDYNSHFVAVILLLPLLLSPASYNYLIEIN